MDLSTAHWLVSQDAAEALSLASQAADPAALAVATQLRKRWTPEQAAAVVEQTLLRRRAFAKMGESAASWWWTRDGLEQATRLVVAGRRAERLLGLGVTRLVDLGCGLGVDAFCAAHAGLRVDAVELDPVTAVLAAANLRGLDAEVHIGDAVDLAPELLADGAAVFIDPARRTAKGRSWRVEDFSPPWPFVTELLDGSRLAVAKLGPGLPYHLIPDNVECEWISDHGTVVEAALWAGPGTQPGLRRAVVDGHVLERTESLDEPPVNTIGTYLHEPDGAVIRAGLIPQVAEQLHAWRIHDGIAYLTSDDAPTPSPFVTSFRVLEVLPYHEKQLRSWVRDHRIGTLEIKKRGLDLDPAVLRKKLRPLGKNAATLILTPTADGARVIVAERC